MIEVLALASAVSTVAGGISSAVQAGKDVGSILPQFGKLAKLEADIHLAEKGRHKGPLGRLTSSEEEGFAIANAKMKHKGSNGYSSQPLPFVWPAGNVGGSAA